MASDRKRRELKKNANCELVDYEVPYKQLSMKVKNTNHVQHVTIPCIQKFKVIKVDEQITLYRPRIKEFSPTKTKAVFPVMVGEPGAKTRKFE